MKTSFRRSFVQDLKKVKDNRLLDDVRLLIEEVEGARDLRAISHLKKLVGAANCYRVRISEYRIGIVVEGDMVDFVRCLPRRDLYKYFP